MCTSYIHKTVVDTGCRVLRSRPPNDTSPTLRKPAVHLYSGKRLVYIYAANL